MGDLIEASKKKEIEEAVEQGGTPLTPNPFQSAIDELASMGYNEKGEKVGAAAPGVESPFAKKMRLLKEVEEEITLLVEVEDLQLYRELMQVTFRRLLISLKQDRVDLLLDHSTMVLTQITQIMLDRVDL